jgi:hypothetical protein
MDAEKKAERIWSENQGQTMKSGSSPTREGRVIHDFAYFEPSFPDHRGRSSASTPLPFFVVRMRSGHHTFDCTQRQPSFEPPRVESRGGAVV